MTDSILQDSDARRRIAQSCQPRSSQRRLLGFGAQQNPIDRRRLRRIGKGAQRNLNTPLRLLKDETFDGVPDTGNHVMPIGCAQAPRHDTPDASEPNNSDGATFLAGWG
jgi:hypothetical protein